MAAGGQHRRAGRAALFQTTRAMRLTRTAGACSKPRAIGDPDMSLDHYKSYIENDLADLASRKGWNLAQTRAARLHLLKRTGYDLPTAWDKLRNESAMLAELEVAATEAASKS
jgi:hypothetical protein